jgi:hypothetical protein
MLSEKEIALRKPIWLALSELYLDTELSETDLENIAAVIVEKNLTIAEAKKIDKYEVFPILLPNVLSVAGDWAGFDKDWLFEKIIHHFKANSKISLVTIEISDFLFKGINKKYWKQIEIAFEGLISNKKTFTLLCREAYQKNLLPFESEIFKNTTYKELETIALNFNKDENKEDFYSYLNIGNYRTNIWAAYFILEKFNPLKTKTFLHREKPMPLVEFCFNLIENNFQKFNRKDPISICSYWLEEKKEQYK